MGLVLEVPWHCIRMIASLTFPLVHKLLATPLESLRIVQRLSQRAALNDIIRTVSPQDLYLTLC